MESCVPKKSRVCSDSSRLVIFWLCVGELKIQSGHKMGLKRICGLWSSWRNGNLCFKRRKIDKDTTDPLQSAYDIRVRDVFLGVIRLGNLEDAWKEKWNTAFFPGHHLRMSGPFIQSSFFYVTNVEVTQNNVHSIGICRPVRMNKTQSFT